jgi:streptogramin lyase
LVLLCITGSAIAQSPTAGTYLNLKLYPVPTANSDPGAITVGSDGALWFAEGWCAIGRSTTAGAFSSYPTVDRSPNGITAGPDGGPVRGVESGEYGAMMAVLRLSMKDEGRGAG